MKGPRTTWRERLRGFHDDTRAQVLPLVLAFGIAFLTGTVLVINTGRTVTDRVQAQNAVDAAAVSGVNAVARGMNYLARNNVQIAKTLATTVVLRSFPPAIQAAQATLEVWTGVAKGLHALAASLAGSVFGAAAAPAVEAAAVVIEIKVAQEKIVLKAIKAAIEPILDVWDDNGNGVGWKLAEGLSTLGTVLAYASPVVAQITAKVVYRRDAPLGDTGSRDWDLLVPDFSEPQAWMIPLFPNLPACKGKFKHFLPPTTHYTEYYGKPIIVAGWVVLTLSLFPVYYKQALKLELRRMFAGGGSSAIEPDTSRAQEVQHLRQRNQDLREEIVTLEDQIDQLELLIDDAELELRGAGAIPAIQAEIASLQSERQTARSDRDAALAQRDQSAAGSDDWNKFNDLYLAHKHRAEKLGAQIAAKQAKIDATNPADGGEIKLRDQAKQKRDTYAPGSDDWNTWNAKYLHHRDRVQQLQDLIHSRQNTVTAKRASIHAKQDEIRHNSDRIQEITSAPPHPEDENVDLGDAMGGSSVQDNDKIFPYLIDAGYTGAPDAMQWKRHASYFVVAWYMVRRPFFSGTFALFREGESQTMFRRRIRNGFVYAAARIYNPTRADLWYPDWRAKLVRAEPGLLTGRNPLGGSVKRCGSSHAVGQPAGFQNQVSGAGDETSGMQDFLEKLLGKVALH